MKLHEEFKLIETLWDSLTESKADTQKLIDFAGDELANRFLAIKNKLKAPENDLYYWIKNKTVDELEQAVNELESTKSNRQLTKGITDAGAKLVAENAYWKVFHITTFEASQKYGRDTKWCISGRSDYEFNTFRRWGAEYYFFIAKNSYDARGLNSKICFVHYPADKHCEVFNQQDKQIKLTEVPYLSEIEIPGINFKDLWDEYYGTLSPAER